MGSGNGQNEMAVCLPSSILQFCIGQNASKCANNICLSIPSGLGSLLENHVLDTFWTHFWSQNGPFLRLFGIFHGPKRVTTGSKRAKNTCLSIPSGLGTVLEKIMFFAPGTMVDPPLAPTVRKPVGIFHGSKRVTTGSKRAKNMDFCWAPFGPVGSVWGGTFTESWGLKTELDFCPLKFA